MQCNANTIDTILNKAKKKKKYYLSGALQFLIE